MRVLPALSLLLLAVFAHGGEVTVYTYNVVSVNESPTPGPALPPAVPAAAALPSAPLLQAPAAIPALPASPALAAAAQPQIFTTRPGSPIAAAQAAALAAPDSAERSGPGAGLDAGAADAALRFDGAAARHGEATIAAARAATSAEVERLLKLKKRGVKVSKVLAAKDTKTITEYSGVPDRVEALPDDGTVYRHWVRNEADLQSILGSSSLRAGPVSYVEFTGSQHAFIKDIYPDLHGVFFTAPDRASSEPRVMNEATPHYVDFRLPRGVRALRLDGKDVMMIPADHGTYIPVEILGSSAAR